MKKLIEILSITLLIYITACVSNSKKSTLDSKTLLPKYFVALNDSVLVNSVEVVNRDYLEFLWYIKKDSADIYFHSMLPDSTLLETGLSKDFIYEDDPTAHYFRFPGFRYFPLVAISKLQIEEYCKWKTIFFNNAVEPKIKEAKYYTFRLPTLEECKLYDVSNTNFNSNSYYDLSKIPRKKNHNKLMISYDSTYSESVEKLEIKNPKKQKYYSFVFGVKDKKIVQVKNKSFFHTKDKGLYNMPEYMISEPKNKQGLYGVIGNVSEMTQNDSIAFGGNYLDSLDYALQNRRRVYFQPSTWLGARLVCEISIK